MKSDSFINIIILTWNGIENTLSCLESLSKSKYSNYKIIISDNHSTDDTVKIVRYKYPNVHLIQNIQHLSYTAAVNDAIHEGKIYKPKYILLLNNDTVVNKLFLTQLINCMDSNPKIGIAASKMYYHDTKKTIWYAGGIVDCDNGIIAHRGIDETDTGKYDKREDTEYCTGCSTLYSVKMLQDIGLFDESYPMYVNDVEMSVRAQNNGYKTVYEPTSVIWHKVTRTRGINNTYKEYQKSQYSVKFFINNCKNGLISYSLRRLYETYQQLRNGKFRFTLEMVRGLISGYIFAPYKKIIRSY